jgi:hypothetical protein
MAMTLAKLGFAERKARLVNDYGGASASSSQDYLHAATLNYELSWDYAARSDGNCSPCALSGIPVLFSALRCLLIELDSGMYGGRFCRRPDVVAALADGGFDTRVILSKYPVGSDLGERLELLTEVRHEIVHPSPRPGSQRNNTPSTLMTLRRQGLLQSTGSDVDYVWIAQLQSHKLFRWAFGTVNDVVDVLLIEHQIDRHLIGAGLRESYACYQQIDRRAP